MTPATLSALIDATWPPAETAAVGPFTLRRGAGGGQRVSAATLDGPFTAADLDAAEAAMRGWRQTPLFMIRAGEGALDAALAARGYGLVDPVTVFVGDAAAVGDPPPQGMACFALDAPLAIMREFWAAGGIGPERQAIMARVTGPRAFLFARQHDRPSGVAFCALHGDAAMLHALEVPEGLRRKGAGANLVRGAAAWAAGQGAATFATLAVAANGPAAALFAALGMRDEAGYHYRKAPDPQEMS
jgi:GNAT superfamily N-acetyltransferase